MIIMIINIVTIIMISVMVNGQDHHIHTHIGQGLHHGHNIPDQIYKPAWLQIKYQQSGR